MAIEPHHLADVPGLEGTPTLVIASGARTVYFTGQIALDDNGEIVGETIEEQAVQLLRNLRAACDAVGVTPADIASLTINVVTDDFDDALAQVQGAAMKFEDFGDVVAAPTMVAVAALYKGALIEVTAVAVID